MTESEEKEKTEDKQEAPKVSYLDLVRFSKIREIGKIIICIGIIEQEKFQIQLYGKFFLFDLFLILVSIRHWL